MVDEKEVWLLRGTKLKEKREKLGLEIRQVACGVGVSENRIKRLERGEPVMDGFMMERAYIYFLELVKRGVCPYSIALKFETDLKKGGMASDNAY